MPQLRDLAAVGADYATTGPNRNVVHRPILASADELFGCLADSSSSKKWQGIDVEWTSPPPLGVGATRTVRAGGQTIDECVLVWDQGRRMCFRYDRATFPLAAFAEDYVITPTSDSSCELTWRYAYEWGGFSKTILGRLFGAAYAIGARRDLRRLAGLIETTAKPN